MAHKAVAVPFFVVPVLFTRVMPEAAEAVVVEQPAPSFASATLDGVTVDSNTGTSAELQTQMGEPAKPAEKPATPAADETNERNADGTFKKIAKPRNDPEARISQAVARQREAERRAEDAERRLAASQPKPIEQPKPQEAAKPTVAEWKRYQAMPDAPKLDQFETIEEYNFAVGLFVSDKRADERDAKTLEQSVVRSIDQTWYSRLNDARTKDPERIGRINPETPLSAPMMHYIKTSPLGVEILQHLSDDQELAQRLSSLHPAEVLPELGEIKATLKAQLEAASSPAPALKAKPQSQATPPIQPVKGSSHVADSDDPGDDASDDEWLRAERARAKRR